MTETPAALMSRWHALATRALKGAAPETLDRTTPDGLALKPLAVAGEPVSVARGPSSVDRAWDLRTLIDQVTPQAARAAILADLEGGAASILLTLDPTGARGLKAPDADDLESALAGVALELAPVVLDAGFDGPGAADRLAVVAKGLPQALLGFHLDPITAFAQGGVAPEAMEAHMRAAANTAARHAAAFPKASLFLASGRAVHEAGGTDAQELAFALAVQVAWLRAGEQAGMTPSAVLDRTVLGVSLDAAYFDGMAKLRALRLLQGRLSRAVGAPVIARIEARSSRRMLSVRDPWTNLLRLTAAGFAGAVGGADAVVLEPFTQGLGPSSAFARRQARNTQLILMEEAHLGRVSDPAAGAWSLDAHARALAVTAWTRFQAIEAGGGILAGLRDGRLAAEVATARDARLAELREGRAQIVGVTRFVDPDPRPAGVDPWPTPQPPMGGSDRCEALLPASFTAPFEEAGQ